MSAGMKGESFRLAIDLVRGDCSMEGLSPLGGDEVC